MRCSQSIKIISEASDPYTSVYRAEALIMVEKRMLTAKMAMLHSFLSMSVVLFCIYCIRNTAAVSIGLAYKIEPKLSIP